MKDSKKMLDAIYGGSLTLQSTNLLKDRSVKGLTSTAEGFVGIGVAGSIANMSYKMVKGKSYTKKRMRR